MNKEFFTKQSEVLEAIDSLVEIFENTAPDSQDSISAAKLSMMLERKANILKYQSERLARQEPEKEYVRVIKPTRTGLKPKENLIDQK